MTYLQRREVIIGLAAAAAVPAILARTRAALATDKIKPSASSALIVVDVQNCFLPGGTLAVKDGDQVIPVINRIAKGFDNVVMTQDWHTPHHMSFASAHGKKPFEMIRVAYGDQVMWPDHCVQNTEDAQIAKGINIPQANLIIAKVSAKTLTATRHSWRRTRKPIPGWRAISRSAASIPSSSPASPPISAWPGQRSIRATSVSRPTWSKTPVVRLT
jgi:hypothetical protein